jgi:hypothetical protein
MVELGRSQEDIVSDSSAMACIATLKIILNSGEHPRKA